MKNSLVWMENMAVGYRDKPVIEEINLQIKPGEFWGILGPNGSGKTTLLKAIAGSLPVMSGELLIRGKASHTYNRQEMALEVAFMLSEEESAPFKVIDTVLMGRYPHQAKWSGNSPEDIQIAEEAIDQVGLWEKKDYDLLQLSQGERQRVWLARALAQDTPTLLLDEPTSHLDIHNQGTIFRMLEKHCLEKKKGIISILHDINLSGAFCTHVLMLKKGRLIIQGERADVLTEENLSELYGVPVCVERGNSNQIQIYPCYRGE